MKTSLKIPFALSLAAVPLWCGQAFAQQSAAPPEPSPSPQAQVKVRAPRTPARTRTNPTGRPLRGDHGGKREHDA